MKSFTLSGYGRVVVINLERGEKLLESIKARLADEGIKNAVITSAIGSLQKAVIHRVTGFEESPVDEFVTVEKPMELASLQGPYGYFGSDTDLYRTSGARDHRAVSCRDFSGGNSGCKHHSKEKR
jgi:predicted DNA-binding protein with PD1-like motif